MDSPDEANSRARGNTEGPINAAPGARLTDGLNEPRNSDIGGQPQPHFQPGTGGPEGQWGLTGPVLQRKPRDDDEPVVVGHLGGDLAQGAQGRQDGALALVPRFAEQCNTAALQLHVAAGAVVDPR